jgi:glyoxylase-like metal-dependent hydrolase (beta-lactamase superfamily II)
MLKGWARTRRENPMIGDEKAGVAGVVDPRFDIDEYLNLARYMGVSVEHIFETHNHADHVSGHGRLAAATGATIRIHRDAQPAYAHEPFDWRLSAWRDDQLAAGEASGCPHRARAR